MMEWSSYVAMRTDGMIHITGDAGVNRVNVGMCVP